MAPSPSSKKRKADEASQWTPVEESLDDELGAAGNKHLREHQQAMLKNMNLSQVRSFF